MDDLIAWLRGVLDGEEASFSQALKEGRFSINRYRRNMADVEAKRAIVGDDDHDGAVLYLVTERGYWSEDVTTWAEEVVRLLASAYADRPGYREEWRA